MSLLPQMPCAGPMENPKRPRNWSAKCPPGGGTNPEGERSFKFFSQKEEASLRQ